MRYSAAYPTGAERCRELCQNRFDLFCHKGMVEDSFANEDVYVIDPTERF